MALKPKITREYLKTHVGDRNALEFYFPYPVEQGRTYSSIFRKDGTPSTGFYVSENGSLIYNDFATGEKYDFVQIVMKLYGLGYYKAMEQIAVDFGLISGVRSSEKEAVIKPIIQEAPTKEEKILKVGTMKYRKEHIDFWSQYGIALDELNANNVYAVKNLYINGYQIPSGNAATDVRFAYLFVDGDKQYLKVYSPYDPKYKWISSVPLNLPFGLDKLKHSGDTLMITKSVKDCILLKKYFPEVIGLQNESKSSLTKETVKALKKCYKHIYIWFDSDKTGKFAGNWYAEEYGFIPVFTPDVSYEKHKVKDPSDFVKQYGLTTFETYLKYINLLNGQSKPR